MSFFRDCSTITKTKKIKFHVWFPIFLRRSRESNKNKKNKSSEKKGTTHEIRAFSDINLCQSQNIGWLGSFILEFRSCTYEIFFFC